MAPEITYDAILRATAAVANLPVRELTGQSRARTMVWPRQRAFFIADRVRPDLSLPNIGRRTGGRDHTTVMHGIRAAEKRYEADENEEVALVDATLRQLGLTELPSKIDRQSSARRCAALAHELIAARARVAALEAAQTALPKDV